MDTHMSHRELGKQYPDEGTSIRGEGMLGVESTVEALSRIELDLSCSSEKLVNLHVLIMHLLAWDGDLDLIAPGNSHVFPMSFEKALEFDLLSGILESEVREVEQFTDNIHAEIVDARNSLSFCKHLKETFITMEEKLDVLEESLNRCQEQLLEVKMQSTKLQRTFSDFKVNIWNGNTTNLSSSGQLSNTIAKKLTAQQQRQALRMLEKSLARQLDLEKKVYELRQSEEQLNIKLHHMEQVAFRMEEAAEVVWGRFLEAENAAEVLMGISRERAGHLQIVQFDLNGSFQRETELKYKLQDCIQQLEDKDIALRKLESSIVEHVAKSSEVLLLKEKIKSLEEQLRKTQLDMKNVNALNEECQEQLTEMEHIVDTLKEGLHEADSRAETAVSKVEELTDTNLELTEEINDLKGSRDSDRRKVSLLEKQVRELEIQLQHSKASSEAGQEQQNMLYSAIWDMETLIEDLKTKLSMAENKTENIEDQCKTLSDTNLELNNEASFLRSRVKALEASLDYQNNLKAASAKEINLRAHLLMDAVMHLAKEREYIQNQLFSPTIKKAVSVEKLRSKESKICVTLCENGDEDNNEKLPLEDRSSFEGSAKASQEIM